MLYILTDIWCACYSLCQPMEANVKIAGCGSFFFFPQFCSVHFEALLLDAYTFKIVKYSCKLILYHYKIFLFIIMIPPYLYLMVHIFFYSFPHILLLFFFDITDICIKHQCRTFNQSRWWFINSAEGLCGYLMTKKVYLSDWSYHYVSWCTQLSRSS